MATPSRPRPAAPPAPLPAISFEITSEQKRAQIAWFAADPGEEHDKFVNLTKSAPALMMASGLMPTLAFLQGKAKSTPHQHLSNILCAWIENRSTNTRISYIQIQEALFRQCQPTEYRLLTDEVLGLLTWLRHFAEARKAGQ